MEDESLAGGGMCDVQGLRMQSLPFHAESLLIYVRQGIINKLQKIGLVHAVEFVADNGIAQ
jgi:hypothetical protein